MSSRKASGRSRFGGLFGSKEDKPQQTLTSQASEPPRPVNRLAVPELPASEERILTSDDLQSSVEGLEMLLRTMDQVRDQANKHTAALKEHARSLRGYAVGINMIAAKDDKGQNITVGEDRVIERVLVHCANYYDRLAESQEHLVYLLWIVLNQARGYLEEYNILNNYAAKYFKTLAKDSANLDASLKELTRKLSKLTHKSAPPGTANTQNISTFQNVGVHENYVQRLTGISGQIQQVRNDHLVEYTKKQKQVDRFIARSFARCSRQNYGFLADAISRTGTNETIGGVNAWGAYAIAGVSPPINDFDAEAEPEGDVEWEGSYESDPEEPLSPREIAQQQPPRPPSAYTNFSNLMGQARDDTGGSRPQMSVNMRGKQPATAPYQASPSPNQHVTLPLSELIIDLLAAASCPTSTCEPRKLERTAVCTPAGDHEWAEKWECKAIRVYRAHVVMYGYIFGVIK